MNQGCEGIRIGTEQIDLQLCLMDSAQCFHWTQAGESYLGIVRNAPVRLYRSADGVCAGGDVDAAELRRYLDLDRDYAALAREFAHIPAAERAIALYPGLRVLNQDPWEALLSFILSANNNVRRIRSLVEALCDALGEEFALDGHVLHGFPSPERLASCEESLLRGLGVGYRAPYLIGTARAVLDGFPLWRLKEMDYFVAHRLLTSLPGVGDKVADCVLLFGCGQTSAFPVDVWVQKLLDSWFGICGCSRKQMMLRAQALLGPHAGLLQQFLFHAARMGDIEL